MTTPVDLSRLPLPDAVEALDYETILGAMKQVMIALAPETASELELESSTILKILQAGAYRELLLRARVNDSVRAVILATSTGADLDGLAALTGVERQVIVEADPDAVPPVAAVLETDAALRRRAQMSPEGLTNAGTAGSYVYHALSADGRVRDAGVTSPTPGRVVVTILSHDDDGAPAPDLLAAVTAVLQEVRPLCDDVAVAAPTFADFAVTAHLIVPGSPGAEIARAAAQAAVTAYLDEARAVGRAVRRSALIARLHQAGVEAVTLTSPAGDVDPGATGVARATAVTLTAGVAP
ncbi:baseplate assembly protein [Paracoccus sediminis]|uniref:Baseplate assembly protein n=1 Tax=Paracoccus sediminis TaxID=1214787 RepID=A0A238UMI0_9RHOB|nr:baseplate J/gp47 family protein [Paracoccus sediminis]TBN53138.1 baseplate assembly protein [Paracoccus sediminis]SNR22857.1 Phage-related baseplate assembly protein [Paracoccus sediminis]